MKTIKKVCGSTKSFVVKHPMGVAYTVSFIAGAVTMQLALNAADITNEVDSTEDAS